MFRRHDKFVIESAPLHTEHPDWAAMAPAQAEAAFKRGAHVIGFTEVNYSRHVPAQLARLASEYGYHWFAGPHDTAVAVSTKAAGHVLDVSHPLGHHTAVEFNFKGNDITVIVAHWPTNHQPLSHRVARTREVIQAVKNASSSTRLAFFMGDSNPDKPSHYASSFPRHMLNDAGLVLVNEEVNDWPHGLGVNVIGHPRSDTRVKGVKVETFDPLGSDHVPERATYTIKRRPRHCGN